MTIAHMRLSYQLDYERGTDDVAQATTQTILNVKFD